MTTTTEEGKAALAQCRDCRVTLQSRTATYCIYCFKARQRRCDCMHPDNRRGPKGCPKCRGTGVYLDEETPPSLQRKRRKRV
jgi:hypothetical protein